MAETSQDLLELVATARGVDANETFAYFSDSDSDFVDEPTAHPQISFCYFLFTNKRLSQPPEFRWNFLMMVRQSHQWRVLMTGFRNCLCIGMHF